MRLDTAMENLRSNQSIPNISDCNPFSPDILPFKFADNLHGLLKEQLGYIDIEVTADASRVPHPDDINKPFIFVALTNYKHNGRNWIAEISVTLYYKDEHITTSEVMSVSQPSIFLCICATTVLKNWHPIRPITKSIPVPCEERGVHRMEIKGTMLVKEKDEIQKGEVEYDLEKVYPLPALRKNHRLWSRIPLGMTTSVITPQEGYSPFTLEWDLLKSPHMIVSGKTGSGKTNTMMALALESYARGFGVSVIDTHKEGNGYYGLSGKTEVLKTVSLTLEETYQLLTDIVEEGERIQSLLRHEKVKAWYELPDNKIPRPQMLLIDEFPLISHSENENAHDKEIKKIIDIKTEIRRLIHKITSTGRTRGHHVVTGCQHHNFDNLPGELRGNAQCVIKLGSRNEDMENSLPPGRGIFYYLNYGNPFFRSRDFQIIQTFLADMPFAKLKEITDKVANDNTIGFDWNYEYT